MTTPTPRLAAGEELAGVAALFADAFVDDPIITWPLPVGAGPDERRALFHILMREYGELDVTWILGNVDAAAIWLPPAHAERFAEIERAMRDRIVALTDDGGARYDSFWDWIGAHLPGEPCWYLDVLAVREDRCGGGLASALVRHGLARARAAGEPAFLETSIASNVPRYEHLGFRVVEQADAPEGGPEIRFMRADLD